jgi:putative transposase
MAINYKRHRFPKEIISHTMWLYHRFDLSLRDISELLSERGILLSYEAIRYWAKKFGLSFACEIKKRSPHRGDKWYLDEVCLIIKGQRY